MTNWDAPPSAVLHHPRSNTGLVLRRTGISRRDFLRASAQRAALAAGIAGGWAVNARVKAADTSTGKVMTVLGAVAPSELGVTLAHEHCVVDFIGAEKVRSPRYDAEEAFTTILPHLKKVKERGCRTFVECTPNYIGRDVRLLKRLATASGLHILTNTGYYGAARNKFLPQHAFTETADQLAERWLREWHDGIDGTGIRPGFIKLGVEKGKLSDVHVKLVRAAARVHLKSGLTIAVHSGDGEAALDELRVLKEEGVAPNALIWVHAQNDSGRIQLEAAKRGAWVSVDGFGEKQRERYKSFLEALRAENLLNRVLLSHDHFWSVEGQGEHGTLKLHSGDAAMAFESIFTHLLPELRAAGFADADIRQLTIKNPAEAFTIRVRKL
jgi:predicted metal-dependent phosphotriesterase family hydrolase